MANTAMCASEILLRKNDGYNIEKGGTLCVRMPAAAKCCGHTRFQSWYMAAGNILFFSDSQDIQKNTLQTYVTRVTIVLILIKR